MINKTEIEFRFKRCIASYDENAYAQKAIIRQLTMLLDIWCTTIPRRILEVGCGTGLLTGQIQQKWVNSELLINDLVEAMCDKTAKRCLLTPAQCIPGDIETIALKGKFDLIVSASTFQWLSHPVETFAHLSHHIYEGGWLVFSTFGPDNFKELKFLTQQGLKYHSIQEMTTLLSSSFEVMHAEEGQYVMKFDDPVEILKHVKKTGVNATHIQQTWTRKKLEDFAKEYTAHFQINGQYPLTYHPQYFICRKLS